MKTTLIPIASLFLGACFIAGLSPGLNGVKADNPLNAQSLTARSRADVFAQGEKDCSFWPLEDEIEVSATDAQICVTTTVLKSSPSESWSGAPPMNRTEFIKIVTNNKEAGPSLTLKKGRESKIGHCRGKSVWSFQYKGCQPNDGTLTADTAWLSADSNRWNFKEEPPPASAGETPASAAK